MKTPPPAGTADKNVYPLPRAAYATRKWVHEISFEPTKEISVMQGETCHAPPRKIARRTGGGFSPLRLVAPRRHGRRRAALAALPAAPAAPLSQKSRFAAIFGSPVYFQGTPFIKSRRIHPHPYAHKGKKEKASFFLFYISFQKSSGSPTCHPEERSDEGSRL